MQVGDLLLLTITGFSPGVGHMGAKTKYDNDAMVGRGGAGRGIRGKSVVCCVSCVFCNTWSHGHTRCAQTHA